MPKNKGKGGKSRRRGKNENYDKISRELIYRNPEEGTDYAQVKKILGRSHAEVFCFSDAKIRSCRIVGKFHRRIYINNLDIVLIYIHEYEQDKGDIIYKYTIDEAKKLQANGEIPKVELDLEEKTDIFFEEDNFEISDQPILKQNLTDSDSDSDESTE